jgi:hypothetical protein
MDDDERTRLICAAALWAGALQAAATVLQGGSSRARHRDIACRGSAGAEEDPRDQEAKDVPGMAQRIPKRLPEIESLPKFKDLPADCSTKAKASTGIDCTAATSEFTRIHCHGIGRQGAHWKDLAR